MMRITPLGASAVVLTVLTSSVLLLRARNSHLSRNGTTPSPDPKPLPKPTSKAKPAASRDKSKPAPGGRSVMVYVTARGRKYHREECISLRGSTEAISLAQARTDYDPCKMCDPPV